MLLILASALAFFAITCIVRIANLGITWNPRIVFATGVAGVTGYIGSELYKSYTTHQVFPVDSITIMAIVIGVVSCLMIGLMEAHPVSLAGVSWSVGCLILASFVDNPWVNWAALQTTVTAAMFYGRSSTRFDGPIWVRHSSTLLGSALFACGYYLHFNLPAGSVWESCSSVLIICGLGGMLNWFPFPRVVSDSSSERPSVMVVNQLLLPVLTAAIVMWRMVETLPFTRPQSFIILLSAIFALVLCSCRLAQERYFTRRLSLIVFSMMSYLIFAIFLQNWQLLNPEMDWALTTNLPTGTSLFVLIACAEVLGFFLLLSAQKLVQQPGEMNMEIDVLAGAFSSRPLASQPLILSLLSLAGVPPFPGFWWRLALIIAFFLPYQKSTLTFVNEVDYGVIAIALTLFLILMVNSLSHITLLQRVTLEQPFRLRAYAPRPFDIAAAMCAVLLLIYLILFPLSLNQIFSGHLEISV